MAEKRTVLKAWSEEEGVSTSTLLGYLTYLENSHGAGDQALSDIGWKIFKGERLTGVPSASVEEAIWLIERSGMSQAVYLEARLRFKDRFYLPPVMHVRAENQRHRPTLALERHGVKAPLMQCLSLTLTERLQHMDLSGLDQGEMEVVFKVCWGLDGSGEHANYNQLTKVSYNTRQVMSVCFALKEVSVKDESGVVVTWCSATAGANKPQNTRPLALFPEKESAELLAEFIPRVEAEVEEVKSLGVNVVMMEGGETVAQCTKCSMSMVDGKMISTLLNCGGAFCTMCIKSQAECHDPETIQAGFMIQRDVEGMKEIALSLTVPETGVMKRRTGDYASRQGVCGAPLTETDLTKNIPVCHSKIRVFSWVFDLTVRELSHQKWATTSNGVRYTKEENALYTAKWEEVKEAVYRELAINCGNPGEMVTGKSFQKFASDGSRAFFVSLLPEEKKDGFDFILLGLSALVKIINSQKRRVNVEKLRELSKDVNLRIVQLFPWAAVSPSVHRILAHSWEVVELNGEFGLGDVSEEGLEALNKQIRRMRQSGSRKDSTENNFLDTFNHLWDRSRPTIFEMERKIKKKKEKLIISTEIEALVDSLFLEE